MCLIAFALNPDPRFRLVLVANRDERYARSTAPAAEWGEVPGLIAGRDLAGGGTWLGVTRSGRFAAVTNFHEPAPPRPDAPSRGALVTDFLKDGGAPESYLARLATRADAFNGFNLLVGDARGAFWLSNRGPAEPLRLESGLYGLSNHLLDTPWPKVQRAKHALGALLRSDLPPTTGALLDTLHDRDVPEPAASDAALSPLERAFSAAFIVTPEYGTRSTSAVILRRDGSGVLAERSYHRGSLEFTEVVHDLV